MKHIVTFSGGANSAYMSKIILDKYPKEDVVLLFHDTKAEHEDAKRFRIEISKYLNKDITEVSDGRSLWELILDYNCLPSQFIPFCTQQLKLNQRKKYLKTIKEDFIVYIGYDINEPRRIQKQMAFCEKENIKCEYPLVDKKMTSEQCKSIIMNDWKICLPFPYTNLKHNNCIPCFKGGKSHFLSVLKYYSEEYHKAEQLEEQLGYTVFKDISLKELRVNYENNISLFNTEIEDNIPCLCALD